MGTKRHRNAAHKPREHALAPWRAAMAVLMVVVMVGCSSTTKQKWLTTFFDGVPDPNAKTNIVKIVNTNSAGSPSSTNAVVLAKSAPLAPPMHKPYQDNNCEACHESKFSVTMKAPMKDLCLSCHKTLIPAVPKVVVHDPIANGECASCHNPHYSNNKFLLVRVGKALCAECHEPELKHPVSLHDPFGNGECLSCHDAHASANKHLVVKTGAKLCFDCHEDFLAKAKFKHDPAGNGDCTSCHNAHASNNKNLLTKVGAKLCEDCHESKDIAAAKGHVNLGKASCIDCHDPHVGNDQYFLKPGKVVAKGPTP